MNKKDFYIGKKIWIVTVDSCNEPIFHETSINRISEKDINKNNIKPCMVLEVNQYSFMENNSVYNDTGFIFNESQYFGNNDIKITENNKCFLNINDAIDFYNKLNNIKVKMLELDIENKRKQLRNLNVKFSNVWAKKTK